MLSPLLHPDLTYNRATIMQSAWAQAHVDLVRLTRAGLLCTLRSCFKDALRSRWDIARGIRATHLWRIEQAAEAQRRLTLPAIERELLELRHAREIAVYIDSYPAMVREIAAIDARLAQLATA